MKNESKKTKNGSTSATSTFSSSISAKTRRISKFRASKWKPIPPKFLKSTLSVLDDVLSCYDKPLTEKSNNQLRRKIRTAFQYQLKSVKIPAHSFMDLKTLENLENQLLDEKKEMEKLELQLTSVLQKERKLNKQLECDMKQMTSVTKDHQRYNIQRCDEDPEVNNKFPYKCISVKSSFIQYCKD